MILEIVLLLVGLAILYFGAEAMVKGASQLALNLGIAPMIVGLTVVAFGTSAPEFVISLLASMDGAEGISVGNIIGSNICNLALILGISSVISPIAIDAQSLRTDYPIMVASSALFYLFALDGELARWEGGVLTAGIVGYVIYSLVRARRMGPGGGEESGEGDKGEEESSPSRWKNIVYLLVGLAGMVGGAKLMVDSSVVIAKSLGISDLIIGLTIVAVGTSLPELATSLVAALRGESDISLGNVLGSNIFNVLFIMGLVPLIFGMKVEAQALALDFPVMLGVMVAAFPLLRLGYRLTRVKGALLLVGYVSYVVTLVVKSQAG